MTKSFLSKNVFVSLNHLYNDFFDVQDGTDGLNDEYFNVGMNDPILEGAQLSGGSRAIELGLTTLKKTKYLANIMLICSFYIHKI